MANYLFAYGSLIESNSRKRTAPKANQVFPARIKGYIRGWFAKIPTNTISTTFLGCVDASNYDVQENHPSVNGVYFEVHLNDLDNLDKREAGYSRVKIEKDRIDDFENRLDNEDILWVYLNDFAKYQKELIANVPNSNTPIVQSYVDICLNGCFEIEEKFNSAVKNKFLEEFIAETVYWNEHWVNDRIYPRRPFIYCPNADKIDLALKKYLKDPQLMKHIKIE
ncbi:MAG: gamma-glutamylcyclotransferase family protein [Bacteroidota bacterium]